LQNTSEKKKKGKEKGVQEPTRAKSVSTEKHRSRILVNRAEKKEGGR